jgi:hypothetical protein
MFLDTIGEQAILERIPLQLDPSPIHINKGIMMVSPHRKLNQKYPVLHFEPIDNEEGLKHARRHGMRMGNSTAHCDPKRLHLCQADSPIPGINPWDVLVFPVSTLGTD